MRIKDLYENRRYTQQDIDQILERLPPGLVSSQVEAVARDYLSKKYGYGTAGFMMYQGVTNDVLNGYNRMYGTNLSKNAVYTNQPKASKPRKKSTAKASTAKQIENKKTELLYKAETLAKEIQKSDQMIDKVNYYLEQWPITDKSSSQDVDYTLKVKKMFKQWTEYKSQKQKEFDNVRAELDQLTSKS